MLKLSEALQKKYHMLLEKNNITPKYYGQYKKWLRYYLDFCKKYHYAYADPENLSRFIVKLSEKRQSDFQQSQAKQAVDLYYSGLSYKSQSTVTRNRSKETVKPYDAVKDPTPWDKAFESLGNEIKLRHYSPKTLKAYTLWAQKFRYFSKDKPPEQLTPSDVKEFLTSLAVEKKVSASSQNQAFNALLFFFRHVLNREFGKIEGVVRAKRKPYIPVVLSRDEIDRIINNLGSWGQSCGP